MIVDEMKLIIRFLLYPLYWISFLFPRNRKKWVFGSFRGAFNDNAKHFFLFVSEKHPEIDAAWVSYNKKTVDEIKKRGVKAYWLFSFSGAWHALTSSIWVYNCYTEDICFYFSGGAKKIDLWHGAVPLKKLEYDVQKGPLGDRYNRTSFSDRITHPFSFQKPDLLVTASDYLTVLFANAFRIPQEHCAQNVCPKNAIQLCGDEERLAYIRKYEGDYVKELIERMSKYDIVYIYMPTWRDSQKNAFVQHFKLDELQDVLNAQNALLLLKPHVNTVITGLDIDRFGNISLLDNKLDVYPILPYTDVLITDYSSIMFEYMLMPGKGIVLYTYDFEEYLKDRDLYFDMDTHSIGKRCGTFEELKETILTKNYQIDAEREKFIREKFWGDLDPNNSNERLFTRILSV